MTASIDTSYSPVTSGSVTSGLEKAVITVHPLPSTLIGAAKGGTGE